MSVSLSPTHKKRAAQAVLNLRFEASVSIVADFKHKVTGCSCFLPALAVQWIRSSTM